MLPTVCFMALHKNVDLTWRRSELATVLSNKLLAPRCHKTGRKRRRFVDAVLQPQRIETVANRSERPSGREVSGRGVSRAQMACGFLGTPGPLPAHAQRAHWSHRFIRQGNGLSCVRWPGVSNPAGTPPPSRPDCFVAMCGLALPNRKAF